MRDQLRSVRRPAALLRRRQLSLRTLIVTVIIVLILPFVGSAFFVMVRLSAAEHQTDEAQSLGIARAFSSEVDRQLLNAEAALNALSTSPQLWNGDFAAFYRQSVAVANQHSAWILLVDASGRPIFNTVHPFGTRLPEFAKESPARIAAATQKPQVSDLIIGSTTNQPLVAVFVPVIANEPTRYVLGMAFRPERLSHVFGEQRLPDDWTIAIVDRNGRFIGRNRMLESFVGELVTGDLKAAIEAANEGYAALHLKDGT